MSNSVQNANKTSKSENSTSKEASAENQSSTILDNRPGTLAQMKLGESMNQGLRSQKSAQLQAIIGSQAPVQRVADEEDLQMKAKPVQKVADEEEVQMKAAPIQRAADEEELQMKAKPIQKVGEGENIQQLTAPVQRAADEEELQMKAKPIQKVGIGENIQQLTAPVQRAADEEELQMKAAPLQRKENNTGLSDNLKSGVEKLSGESLDDVQVHRNSDQPAQMQAHAFAQGNQIHVAPGQEKHLPHEAWHVAQQKQGRVKPTTQMKGKIPVNDDKGLEHEADVMGAKALKLGTENQSATQLKEVNTAIQKSAKSTVQKEGSKTTKELFIEKTDKGKIAYEGRKSSKKGPGGKMSDKSSLMDGLSPGAGSDSKFKEGEADKDDGKKFLGGKLDVKGTKEGDATIEFTHPLFIASGSRKVVGDPKKNKFEYSLKGTTAGDAALGTDDSKGSFKLPLPPVPLGVPGLSLRAYIEGSASASISGSGTFTFKSIDDEKFTDVTFSGACEAVAKATLGIAGGVTAGIPAIAGVTVGAYGDLTASLSGKLELVGSAEGLQMNTEIAGEAKGQAGVFAEISAFWVTTQKKVPIVEGLLGEFKGKKENIPFSREGLSQIANLKDYSFLIDKDDQEKAEAIATANHEKAAVAVNKST